MANALFDKGRESFLKGEIDWSTDTIKAVLVDTGTYTVDLVNHQFYSDLTGVVGSASAAFTTKTTTAGVADADNLTFTAVSGATAEALVIYQDTGTTTTSRLIAYIDTATGLPVTPNGGDITVSWDNGSNKIFKL
jgi:hypothetical protein